MDKIWKSGFSSYLRMISCFYILKIKTTNNSGIEGIVLSYSFSAVR